MHFECMKYDDTICIDTFDLWLIPMCISAIPMCTSAIPMCMSAIFNPSLVCVEVYKRRDAALLLV